MIDWLRKDMPKSSAPPQIAIANRILPIRIHRHARAKRLTMRLAHDGSALRITMPRWGQSRDAIAFANARRDWIERQLAAVPQPRPIAPQARIPFCGPDITIAWDKNASRQPHLVNDALIVGGPVDTLENRVRRWLEAQALDHAASDLAHYCARARQPVPALRLSRAHKRWGSCSGKAADARCIRINWRLIMAPEMVRRSVVAHEVAHLVHFDHSPAFHAFLGNVYDDDLATADRWLKDHGRMLYAVCA